MTSLMSTSLKVVSMAAVFCASFRRRPPLAREVVRERAGELRERARLRDPDAAARMGGEEVLQADVGVAVGVRVPVHRPDARRVPVGGEEAPDPALGLERVAQLDRHRQHRAAGARVLERVGVSGGAHRVVGGGGLGPVVGLVPRLPVTDARPAGDRHADGPGVRDHRRRAPLLEALEASSGCRPAASDASYQASTRSRS